MAALTITSKTYAPKRPVSRWRERRGFTLLYAMALLALLIVVVFAFVYEVGVDRAMAENVAFDFETTVAAKGAINYGLAQLRAKDFQETKKTWDSLLQPWAQEFTPPGLQGVEITAKLTDEERKLNLLYLGDTYRKARKDTTQYRRYQITRATLEVLIREIRGESSGASQLADNELDAEQLLDNLEDWINEPPKSESYELRTEVGFQDEKSAEGETDVIEKESPFPMVTLEELRFAGFTARLIYGPENADFINAAEEEEAQARLYDATLDETETPLLDHALADYVTVYSTMRVNVNTADPLLFAAMCMAVNTVRAELDAQNFKEEDLDFPTIHQECLAIHDLRTNGSAAEEERDPLEYPNAGEPGWDAAAMDNGVIGGETITGARNNGVNDAWEQQIMQDEALADADTDTRNSFRTTTNLIQRVQEDPEHFPTIAPLLQYLQVNGMFTTQSRYFLVTATATKVLPVSGDEDAKRRALTKTINSWFERDARRNFRLIVQNIE